MGQCYSFSGLVVSFNGYIRAVMVSNCMGNFIRTNTVARDGNGKTIAVTFWVKRVQFYAFIVVHLRICE